jgi:hypothetical protein
MGKKIVFLLLFSVLLFSCGTVPEPPESPELPEAPSEPEVEVIAPYEPEYVEESVEVSREENFDPDSISDAVFQSTKREITAFINELNGIIRARNYSAWVAHLSDSYFLDINSKKFLEEKTEELYRRDQVVAQNLGKDPNFVEKRILRTARNYFDYVVVPSRANDRLDDIGFLSETRVRAYTVDERRGQRLVLYDLAYINHKWLIVN